MGNVRVAKELIESVWSAYPRKQGKKVAEVKIKNLIKQHGYEKVLKTVMNYVEYIKKIKLEPKFIPHGSTFFTTDIYDYLDENNFSELIKMVEPRGEEAKPKKPLEFRQEWY